MCQRRGKRRACASQICANYCSFKQDKQGDEEDDGDDDDDDSQSEVFMGIKYQDADCNEERMRFMRSFRGVSSKRRAFARDRKMSLIFAYCLALILAVICFLECSNKFVACDNKTETTSHSNGQTDQLKAVYEGKSRKNLIGKLLLTLRFSFSFSKSYLYFEEQ